MISTHHKTLASPVSSTKPALVSDTGRSVNACTIQVYCHVLQLCRNPLLRQRKAVPDKIKQNGGKTVMCHEKATEEESNRFMHKSHEILNDGVRFGYLPPQYIVLDEMKGLCI